MYLFFRWSECDNYRWSEPLDLTPIMNVIKKTPPDERMAYLVVVIVQEGNNKQFRVCLMSQNRGVHRRTQGGGGGGGGGGRWVRTTPPPLSEVTFTIGFFFSNRVLVFYIKYAKYDCAHAVPVPHSDQRDASGSLLSIEAYVYDLSAHHLEENHQYWITSTSYVCPKLKDRFLRYA